MKMDLPFLISKERFVNRWKAKALKYLLAEVAPRLASKQDYYQIEQFHQVIRRLNEPFQPCGNQYTLARDQYVVGVPITCMKVTGLIRRVMRTEKPIKEVP